MGLGRKKEAMEGPAVGVLVCWHLGTIKAVIASQARVYRGDHLKTVNTAQAPRVSHTPGTRTDGTSGH